LNIVEQMRLFMEPRSVALVGLTRSTGLGGWNVLEYLLGYGYKGKIFPVNPSAENILGVQCYRSVAEIPENVDLAVILTPAHKVKQLVTECTAKGIKALAVVAQGMADGDSTGAKLQQEIVRLAHVGGARVIGPNTFGVGNAFVRFNSAFTFMDMHEIPLGVICQTGLFMSGLPDFPMVGKGIDLGNMSDIDFSDGLQYFEDDPNIKVIFLYIEGMKDGKRFMQVARRVSRKKPIIAIKGGRSEVAAEATMSHSGSLAGTDATYDAAFKQCGVLRVSGTEDFQDLGRAFLNLPLMKGRNVGIITITGGGGILAAEALARHNLRLANLSTDSLSRLHDLAPKWHRFNNPADIWPPTMIAGNPLWEVLNTTIDTFLRDDNVDGLFVIMPGIPSEAIGFYSPLLGPFRNISNFDKPAVLWCYGTEAIDTASLFEREGRILYYPTMDRAANVLSRLNDYYKIQERDND